MPNSIVLTTSAKFKCAHMPAPIGTSAGISVSLTGTEFDVDGGHPILQGATISGFSAAAGCSFNIGGSAKPCESFSLSGAEATGLLSLNGRRVYTQADLAAIATLRSTENQQPGLTIVESQRKLKA